MREITINPITRLEGHGKITIFLDERGFVENAYLQIPEFRGFEKFCIGRSGELLPQITSRICGVCSVAHHLASAKALDEAFKAEPPPAARKLRELMHCGYIISDHILHFYYLAAPDFLVGPRASPRERNIIGLARRMGLDLVKQVIRHRAYGQNIVEIIGGKAIHPVCGLPGGVSKPLTEEERGKVREMAESCVDFAKSSLKLFHELVLENREYEELIESDIYKLETYYMGLVDENNRVNLYDGKLRIVDPNGGELLKFDASEYLDVVEEHVVEWSYVKMPYLKRIGWRGLTDGAESGVYRVGPLARLNAAEGMATPLADEEYRLMYKTLGKPAHSLIAYHWARLIEILYAAERAVELAGDPEVTSPEIRSPVGEPGEGVGVVEAARGTLIHHYKLDGDGLIEDINIITPTASNYASICMSIRNAARGLIKGSEVSEGLLNMVEMAYRAYDPCMACASHHAIGELPLTVEIYDHQGRLMRRVERPSLKRVD